jgi:hypothetical protein
MNEPITTSILELLYLIRAKNKGELSFAECWEDMQRWARAVIAEYEGGGQSIPLLEPIQEDECPSSQ